MRGEPLGVTAAILPQEKEEVTLIFFAGSDGSVIRMFPSAVRQGSVCADEIILIAPFAAGVEVAAAFRLPDGREIPEEVMTPLQEVEGVTDANGCVFSGWFLRLPASVATRAGKVVAQFYFYLSDGGRIASEASEFAVSRGVCAALPEQPDESVYTQILNNLSDLSSAVTGGEFASRAVFAWREDGVYGANEICYVPDEAGHGSFVRSKVAGNSQPPYVGTALNVNAWEELIDFSEIYAAFEKAETNAEDALSAAASAEESMRSAVQSAESAILSAENASSAETNAENASAEAQVYAREAEQIVSGVEETISGMIGGLATKEELEKLVEGEVVAAHASFADEAGKTSFPLKIVVDGDIISFSGEKEETVTINTSSSTDPNAVHFTPQTLSEQFKQQARANIGAQEVGDYQPAGNYVTSEQLTEALAGKANTSGEYADISAGHAADADNAVAADRATCDENGDNIVSTYARKDGSYGSLHAGSADTAETAQKAAADSAGNEISATYLKTQALLDKTYPVGSIYMSLQSTSPASLFGGSWTQITNKFLYATGTYGAGATGGSEAVTLTLEQLPSHGHSIPVIEAGMGKGGNNQIQYDGWGDSLVPNRLSSDISGSNQPHNNMPPFYVVYMWRRTA